MTPGFAKTRAELPWLYYPETDRVIINAHNFGGGASYDTDAAAYIAAVEAADGASLATKYKDAINDFVVGAKADGFWTAIKAACFLAGPASLSGALVPLIGTAPTNTAFVSGDYSQASGLAGDGSTKYLNANRLANADPQNNRSQGVWLSATRAATNARYMEANATRLTLRGLGSGFRLRGMATTLIDVGATAATSGLIGFSRSNSTSVDWIHAGENGNSSSTSVATTATATIVFAGDAGAGPCASRLGFYWIGEALSLTNLSARLATYMAAIA